MATGEKSYTPAGNIRAPSKLLCLQWVIDRIMEFCLKEYFISCSISVNMDGSGDQEIHCLKHGEIAAAAKTGIQLATVSFLASSSAADDILSSQDPFADLD